MISKPVNCFKRVLKDFRGMTLIELLVVLAMMGLLLALASPTFSSFSEAAKYKKGAREVASVIRIARSRAISTGYEHRVQIDIPNRKFRLAQGDRYAGSTASSWDNNVITDWQLLSPGISLRGNLDCSVESGVIYFHANPNGTTNTRYLCLADDLGKFRFRVGIPYAVTGKVLIHQWGAGSGTWH